MNNHTYTIYNSLVKRAAMKKAAGSTAGATMQAPTQEPKTYPVVNPATGGARISYKTGRPIGPVEVDSDIRKGPLPITPYSSGKIGIDSMAEARKQAYHMMRSQQRNEARKKENAQNLDVMFKNLHEINQQRRSVGVPDYIPNAMDVYAPNANSETDYADAENRIYNDIAMSTVAAEAARRGTPIHPAEIRELSFKLPNSGEYRQTIYNDPRLYNQNAYMGIKLNKFDTPDRVGRFANGVPE